MAAHLTNASRSGKHVCLVFGSETCGLDDLPAQDEWPQPNVEQQDISWAYIPMKPESTRSLNLSNTVAMACFDVLRQNPTELTNA